MPNPFQSAAQINAPFGSVKETPQLPPLTGRSIAIGLFSDINAAAGSWNGTPPTWASANGNDGIGFVEFTGPALTRAGPLTHVDPNYDNWGAILLLFAANAAFSLFLSDVVVGGAWGAGPQSALIGADIPAGATLLAFQQGTALFFPDTPDLTSASDTAGNMWSPVIKAAVLSGPNVIAEAAVSVAMNCVHSLPNTNTVTMNYAAGGNNATAFVLGFTGAIPFIGGNSQGSMLL